MSETFVIHVRYQVVKAGKNPKPDRWLKLNTYFMKRIFGYQFRCAEPTRFTQEAVFKKITDTVEKIRTGDLQTQLDQSAHLEVWAGLFRALALENTNAEYEDFSYEIFIWF